MIVAISGGETMTSCYTSRGDIQHLKALLEYSIFVQLEQF